MKKQEILEIAKKLIMLSAKYKKVDEQKEKQKLLKIFQKYEKELSQDNTKYSEVILWFVIDLKNDLQEGRELNIDNLKTDEYLENYLLIKQELKYFNSLILQDSYRKIFDEILKKDKQNKKIISSELDKIYKNFISNFKKLNSKIIAKNLLIFTSFDRVLPKSYLVNLYKFLSEKNQKQKVLELLDLYNFWVKKVKAEAIKNYKENNFNYKYIWFKNINWKSVLADKIVDCSKIGDRIWSVRYEYRRLILGL